MSQHDISQLLTGVRDRTPGAADKLISAVYRQLRQLAAAYLRKERPDHTLQPTALINEAYLKLFAGQPVEWRDREHFFAAAAQSMRRILVDHARGRQRDKRGGAREKVTLEERLVPACEREVDLLGLDEALAKLSRFNPGHAHLVELRFFAGLTTKQAAETLGVSTSTVERDWRSARAWLLRELTKGATATG